MREIILDTETTGLDPKSGHRLVEIGMLEMHNKILTGNKFHFYINPERDMPEEAYRIHGISAEFLADKPLFVNIADEFLDFVSGGRLVIHNAVFDMKFINHELSIIGRPSIDMTNVVDTLPMARRMFPGAKANLDALCRRFKIDNSSRKFHGALLDAELLSEVYVELTGGRQVSFSISAKVKKDEAVNPEERNIIKSNLNRLVVMPTEEELKQHSLMKQKIPSALWAN